MHRQGPIRATMTLLPHAGGLGSMTEAPSYHFGHHNLNEIRLELGNNQTYMHLTPSFDSDSYASTLMMGQCVEVNLSTRPNNLIYNRFIF